MLTNGKKNEQFQYQEDVENISSELSVAYLKHNDDDGDDNDHDDYIHAQSVLHTFKSE